jgi:hypothetical protein
MTITSVSRWRGRSENPEFASDIATVMKRHGAVSVRIGVCHSGAHAGQTYSFITFPDWATYGHAMQGVMADEDFSELLADLSETAELQERFVVSGEDL